MRPLPPFLPPLLLAVIVALTFSPALTAGFVWDDENFFNNPLVVRPDGLWSIWFHPFSNPLEEHYWPVTYTVFWLEYRLWGAAPLGAHLVNLLIHVANALLVYHFLRRENLRPAFLAALLFAVHPTKVESVAWVIELKDTLSGLFYLLAFLAAVRFEQEEGPRRTGSGVMCLLCFVLGLLSKSSVVTFPVGVGLYLWWKRDGRIGRPVLLLLGFLLVAAGAILLFDMSGVNRLGRSSIPISWNLRRLIAGEALWFYVMQTLMPINLNAIHPWNLTQLNPEPVLPYLYLPAAVLVTGALWLGRGRIGRGPAAAAMYFIVTLSPTLGFVPFSFMKHSLVADRFLYLAVLGLIVPAAVAGARLDQRAEPRFQYLLRAAAAALALSYAYQSWSYCRVYHSIDTLFRDVLRKNPDALAAHINLGDYARHYGWKEEAAGHYGRGLQVTPEYTEGRIRLAQVLLELGRTKEAARQARIALRLQPHPEAQAILQRASSSQETSSTLPVEHQHLQRFPDGPKQR